MFSTFQKCWPDAINMPINRHNLAEANQRDAAAMLYENSYSSLAISFFYVVLLTFSFQNPHNQETKVLWGTSVSCILLIRLIDALLWYTHKKGRAFDGPTAIRNFSIGVVLSAVGLSFYPILFFNSMDSIEFASVAIVFATMISGASTTLAPSRLLVIIYPWATLLAFVILSISSEQSYQQNLGFIGLVFMLLMSVIGFRLSRFILSAVSMNNERRVMQDRIDQEQQEVHRVNIELKNAYKKLHQANDRLEFQVKERTDKITQLSNKDPLTQLLNRASFRIGLEALMQRRKADSQLALLFIDLEGFKQVNDSLGHQTGDHVLSTIAKRIDSFSESGLAGRWGGDEFLLALPHTDAPTALLLAKALQSSIQQIVTFASNELSLNATIGIAVYPTDTDSATNLIQYADFAMYEQKRNASTEPNLFTPKLLEDLKQAQQLTEGLKQAISTQALDVYYQPIMYADGKRIWGYEALLRWTFAGEFIRPDIFIALAEKIGMIKEIGVWVLNRACIDASHFLHEQDCSVCVNVSVIQLMDDDFINYLDAAISQSNINPQLLHLEITETVFADSKRQIQKQLAAIKQRGVKVSIDDFGTGYSSLSQLQELAVNHVKIDKSFVHSLDKGGSAIINATLSVAQAFSCKTVAEGIETPEQAERLSAMGVDYLQGFYFGKPMNTKDLRRWQVELGWIKPHVEAANNPLNHGKKSAQ